MNIVATILLIGASGSATASREYDQQIAGIVARVAWGAVSDVFQPGAKRGGFGSIGKMVAEARPTLTIDCEPRTGWRAWTEAAVRIGAYAIDARSNGSVALSYRLQIRKYHVATSTAVSDGRVVKTVDAWWTETVVIPLPKILQRLLNREAIIRELPIHVRFEIIADETGGDGIRGTQTVLVGTATGTADTSDFHCGLVRRIAERQAAATLNRELAAAFVAIEHKGTDWYHQTAEYTDILDRIGDAMRTVGRIRR